MYIAITSFLNLFSTVLNMTITGSIVIACVLAARLALKHAPRVFSWALWLVVLFRLLYKVPALRERFWKG